MNYHLADKGFIQRKRESVLSIIADPNMTPTHSHIFERLLIFVSPFSFKFEISDGVTVKKVELPQGSLVTSTEKLVELTHCCRNTLFTKLKDLHNWEYILYGSLDSKSGTIKYTRKSNQYQQVYIQIKDYEYHVEIGSTKFGLAEENGKTKNVLPDTIGSTKFGLPLNLVEQDLTNGKAKFELPNLHKSNDNNKLDGLLKQQQQYLFNNKQQQENVVVELQKLFYEKAKSNIPQNVVLILLKKFLMDDIKTNIKRLKFKNVDNPIGLLIRSLEEGYELLPTQEEIEVEKKAIEEKQNLERVKELEEHKKVIEEDRKRFNLLEDKYNTLSKRAQNKLRDKAISEIKSENKTLGETGLNFILRNEKTVKIKMLTILEREGEYKKGILKKLWERSFGQ